VGVGGNGKEWNWDWLLVVISNSETLCFGMGGQMRDRGGFRTKSDCEPHSLKRLDRPSREKGEGP